MTIQKLILTSALLVLIPSNAESQLPFEYLRVGEHRIEFNLQMTFNDAATLLGNSEIHRRGDAGGSLGWTCYRVGTDGGAAVLILESSEMGGRTQLTGFQLAASGTLPDLEVKCTPVEIPPTEIKTDRGICLGMRRAEVELILGQPTESTTDSITFNVFETRHDLLGNPPHDVTYDACSYLRLWFVDDRVIRMEGNRIDVI